MPATPTGRPRKRPPVPGKGGGARQRTAQQQALERKRDMDAVQLVLAGKTYDEIGAALGYTDRSGAWKAVQRCLERDEHEHADQLRTLEGARLERLLTAAWPAALRGDVKAGQFALNIISRRCRLYGLDAPLKVETVSSEIDAEIRALAAELGLAAGGDPVPTE